MEKTWHNVDVYYRAQAISNSSAVKSDNKLDAFCCTVLE